MAAPAGAVAADTKSQPNGLCAGKSTNSNTRKANMFVLTHDLGLGDATAQSAAPPAWPANPEPTGSRAVLDAPASGLDWSSAGIGAGAGIGAVAIALALAGGLRRRRIARPRSLTTP
jgi:hypothetical protein